MAQQYSQADIDAAVKTMIVEGLGEGPEGLAAIAGVILNRARRDNSSLTDVVTKPGQFSGVTSPGKVVAKSLNDPAVVKNVEGILRGVINGTIDSGVGDADYFKRPEVNPAWSKEFKQVATVGSHQFYSSGKVPPAPPLSVVNAQGNAIDWGGYSQAVNPKLLNVLNGAQAQLPFNLTITSSTRTATQNKAAKGVSGSEHLGGGAVDISLKGLTDAQKSALVATLVRNGASRIGIYSGADGRGGLHVDMKAYDKADPRLKGAPVWTMYDGTIDNFNKAPAWYKQGLQASGAVPTPATPSATLVAARRGITPTDANNPAVAAAEQAAGIRPSAYMSSYMGTTTDPRSSVNPTLGLSPRLDANGAATFGGLPRDLTAADYGAARASLFNPAPAAFVSPGGVLPGGTLTGQPRTMAPMTLANMPSSYYTGQLASPALTTTARPTYAVDGSGRIISNTGAVVGNTSPSFTYQGMDALRRQIGVGQSLPPGYTVPTASVARPVAAGQVALPIYRPASPPNSAPPVTRNVTTVTVRPNGSVSGTNAGNTVGSTALPADYRPNVPALPSPRTSVYANIPLYAPASPPPARPISQYGNVPVYAPASPPPVSYGFGGTPVGALPAAQKKQAPIPQMRPSVATGIGGGYSTGTASGNYTVKPGETLGQIAARYGVSVQQLAQQSGVADPNRIAAGAKLVVPTTAAKQTTSSSSAGLKPPSSSSSSSSSSGGQTVTNGTFKGSATGTVYKVGQVYSTSSGGKVMAMADGTFKKV